VSSPASQSPASQSPSGQDVQPSSSGSGRFARALVLETPGHLEERRIELPVPGEGAGLLRVEACGLCGTDHEQYSGALPAGFPFIPGHEVVGIVEELGPHGSERLGVHVGDRVAVEVFQSCRTCAQCLSGTYRRCEAHGILDMYGFIDVRKAPGLWGGYATYQYLGPDSLLLPVPPNLDPVVATLFNPIGAGIRWGVTVPGTAAGDVVCVLGPGIRGLSACAAAREAGASFVMVTGAGRRDHERLELAKSFGADVAVDVMEEDPVRALKKATGGKLADVVVDVTAKAPAALGQGIQLAGNGGTVVLAGTRGSAETPGFWPDLIVYKELRILGALGVDAPAYREALALLASDKYPFAHLARSVVKLEELEGLLAVMAGQASGQPPVHGVVTPE